MSNSISRALFILIETIREKTVLRMKMMVKLTVAYSDRKSHGSQSIFSLTCNQRCKYFKMNMMVELNGRNSHGGTFTFTLTLTVTQRTLNNVSIINFTSSFTSAFTSAFSFNHLTCIQIPLSTLCLPFGHYKQILTLESRHHGIDTRLHR